MTVGKARGFTYLMLLWWVAISGILLTALAQRWSIETRRQREMDLVFRGEQIKAAIQAYYDAEPDGDHKHPPTSIEDLLTDRRGGVPRHHLRRAWPDPITGGQAWGLVRDGRYIRGVFSTSTQRPLRAPKTVETYADWRFEAEGVPVTAPVPASAASTPLHK